MATNIEYYHDIITEAEQNHYDGEACNRVLIEPKCHEILRGRLDRYVEYALDERDVFVFHIASLMRDWNKVFTDADHLMIANELRGASVLRRGLAGYEVFPGERFDGQRWWPS